MPQHSVHAFINLLYEPNTLSLVDNQNIMTHHSAIALLQLREWQVISALKLIIYHFSSSLVQHRSGMVVIFLSKIAFVKYTNIVHIFFARQKKAIK